MSQVAIPSIIQYSPTLPVLPPETTNTTVVISPSNGSSFSPTSNNQLIFDLGSGSGFLDPATLTLRFKVSVTNGATAQTQFGGGYAFISRLETLFGSQIVEAINSYGVVYNDFVSLQYNLAQKASLAMSYGFLDSSTVPTLANVNGFKIPASATTIYTIAIPLVGLLSCSEKLLPLFAMPNVRIQLTLDTIANIFSGSTVTEYTITNPEISYDMIRFGAGVEQLVRAMGEKIYIKSQSFTFTGSSLATGSSGNVSLIYNQRLSSLKGVLLHMTSTDTAKCVNRAYDTVDITGGNGTYQFFINSIPYPSRYLDTNLKSTIMSELRGFIAGYHNIQGSNMSIIPLEWYALAGSTTTNANPGKFMVGVNCEKIQDAKNSLLSGISTSNSPISVAMSLNTATPAGFTVSLLCMYDALIEIDTVMKNATVKV
jgi:hypothetical protein